ncbi:MAG: ribonuclease T2 [Campylobacterota bacterium]|nr:ribonuclease T2 [Campylobacterota bacterium]
MKRLRLTLTLFLLIGAMLYAYVSKSNSHTSTDVSTNNLLAISWQNAFCETHQKKRECRNIKATDFSASHFTLHGLWPQPRDNTYCKKSKKVWLEKPLYTELLHVMPAAKSGLHQHEWKKHGTCYNSSQEQYFKDSILLLKQINNSAVRDFFAKNIGKTVTAKQVRLAFDRAFGQGSGRKVKMQCHKGLITELHVNLQGNISALSDIDRLLKDAKYAQNGCQKGRIDGVGFSRY